MVHPIEYMIFTIIVGGNILLGLYFSFRKRAGLQDDTDEVFLGNRTLAMFPLAVSVLASMMSALGIVGFTAHYYAYGIHMMWGMLPMLVTMPFITIIIVPVFYRLKITSVFEYHRMRFGSSIAAATCALYFLFAQSLGALCIYTASLAVSTVFGFPVTWCSLVIGLTGTVYTALGGLRGVVWTDCVQAIVILAAPATIIVKVLWDASKRRLRPMTFEDFKPFAFQYNLDFTQDENLWSCLIGLLWTWIYRAGLDQIMVQRYLASRTLRAAQRTAWWGTLLIIAYFIVAAALGLIMAYWYRDCDPMVAGVITSLDQVIPYYVNTHLAGFIGFSGLFLAGVVGATTSTISSAINSLAAVTYVEFVAMFAAPTPKVSLLLTKLLAFASGIIMSLYAIVIPYMGSTGRVLMVLQSCITAPFVSLSILGLAFPWVDTKAAVIAAAIGCAWQGGYTVIDMMYGTSPPRMAASLDECAAGDFMELRAQSNLSLSITETRSQASFVMISSYWNNFIITTAMIFIGLLLSLITDGQKHYKKNLHLTSAWFLKIWVNHGIISQSDVNQLIGTKEQPLLENGAAKLSKLSESSV
ncbi:sodium-coupled monocarboxylate transporter 2 isoform X1 [Rhipicephalus microplus]|uniref:sodium-coupled monocarboxylate transporter 2 isoform X1 n=1 Tax=Rhipicephalus microplus TaxID=6941 RepID=UPI003F6CC020